MTVGRIIQQRNQKLPKLEGATTLVRRAVTIHRGLLLYLPFKSLWNHTGVVEIQLLISVK